MTHLDRIAELTAAWEDAVNYGAAPEDHARASDYSLSEDDWRVGLSDDEAAEIVALIERQAERQTENQKRAERIARTIASQHADTHDWHVAHAAALQALTETENTK